jgi:hypothetical protein
MLGDNRRHQDGILVFNGVKGNMRVLIACEFSGIVRDAFIKRGHDAISCDFLPTERPGPHWTGDIFKCLRFHHYRFDLMIAHPPYTYLCSSGLHWNKRVPGRQTETEAALSFVLSLMNVPIERIAIENPIGCISSRIRKPDQIIQPWMFGHDASKSTCLWLKGLPKLIPTNIIKKDRYENQTASGQNKLTPGPDRWKLRSVTYQGIADAMANQWNF